MIWRSYTTNKAFFNSPCVIVFLPAARFGFRDEPIIIRFILVHKVRMAPVWHRHRPPVVQLNKIVYMSRLNSILILFSTFIWIPTCLTQFSHLQLLPRKVHQRDDYNCQLHQVYCHTYQSKDYLHSTCFSKFLQMWQENNICDVHLNTFLYQTNLELSKCAAMPDKGFLFSYHRSSCQQHPHQD